MKTVISQKSNPSFLGLFFRGEIYCWRNKSIHPLPHFEGYGIEFVGVFYWIKMRLNYGV